MPGFYLSKRSKAALEGVHPDLVRVVNQAIKTTKVDFVVTEGLRSRQRQRELVAKGASQTMRSRHITGHAVDLAPWVAGSLRWDWPLFYQLANAMKNAAAELDVDLEWGGDWQTFKDGPHFQLSHARYPA